MAKIFKWLKSASSRLIDPNREVILADQSRRLEERLFADPNSFELHFVAASYGILPEDVRMIANGIYRRAAEKAWRDQVVTEKERRALDRLASLLNVSPADQRNIELSFGLEVFERALAGVTADGIVDDNDGRRLTEVAESLGTTVRQLVLDHFAERGEAIVRAMFAAIAEDGRIDEAEWGRLVRSARSFGLDESDVRQIVRAQAVPFVEHVLAEAKADGRISPQERARLGWLLSTLDIPVDFRAYVAVEVARLEQFEALAQGRLPTIACNDAGLRAGELTHFRAPALFYFTRRLKSGPRLERLSGEIFVTDTRLIFTSPEKTLEVNHRRILSVAEAQYGIEVRCSGKANGIYWAQDLPLALAVIRVAVGRANQTVVDRSVGPPTRHVSRDVRQRVWQKYGGRCAECGSTQYLEFDHIIPHARGGNNSENNVQLLCRGCNGRKSNLI